MHLGRWSRVCVLLALALLAAAPARAGYLHGVASFDGVDVIAVGDSGMVFRSVDGGALAAKSYLGSTPLRDVARYDMTIVIVGDGGQVVRTTDDGLNWSTDVVAGTPNLLRVVMPTASRAYAIGESGAFLRSEDGGQSWTPLATGTSATLRDVKFTDALHGWIVGDGGFIASTADGGDHWDPGTLSTPNALYAIDQLGSRVWAAGANSTCWKSVNGGTDWTPVNLRIDSRSDVRAVKLQSADSVFIAGGGGFIRRSVDDGATWTFLRHDLTANVADMDIVGQRGWVVSSVAPVLMRTSDAGDTWAYAIGTVLNRTWDKKQTIEAGSVRGSPISINPVYRSTLYCAVGSRFYVSRNDGETWTQFSQLPAGYTKANVFIVSPKDSMKMVITASPPQAEMYSIDGGATWNLAATRVFGEYGIPIEMLPDQPDTLLLGGDNSVLYRSTDFGQSWAAYGSKIFRSPCDLIAVPESDSNLVIVADGITGSGLGDLWRSTDGGVNFTKQYTTVSSEIPGLSMSRLDNTRAYGTSWSSGGVERTEDDALTWTPIQSTLSTWGIDVCDEDPNVVVYSVYSGSLGYISFDGGDTFTSYTLGGSNYGIYARDRGCILALQGGGMFKLESQYTFYGNPVQNLAITSANGGEVWAAGSTHDITWNSVGVVTARVEYQISPGDPWVLIGQVPSYYGKISWTLPYVASSTVRVRVSDASDASPVDESNGDFTIALPQIASAPTGLDFGLQLAGQSVLDSVQIVNSGTATLDVASATTATAYFTAASGPFSLGPGQSKQLHVTFDPGAAASYLDTIVVVSNAYDTPELRVPLAGQSTDTPVLSLLSPDGGEVFQYGTSQKVSWQSVGVPEVDLEYRVGDYQPWIPIATHVPSSSGTYDWVIPDAATNYGRLRVHDSGGVSEDISSTFFQIVVPRFHSLPYDIRDIGPVLMGDSRTDTLRITNAGGAPLTLSSITSDRPTFVLGRSSMVVPPGKSDTLGITYTPVSTDRDTAVITFMGDDPDAPHQVKATGFGTMVTGVAGGGEAAFALGQNLPNPFQGVTRINFALPRESDVTLDVFNLQGQRVATLVNGRQPAGRHSVIFAARRTDGSVLPSGVYFYRFRAGAFTATRKMLLMH